MFMFILNSLNNKELEKHQTSIIIFLKLSEEITSVRLTSQKLNNPFS